MMNRKAIGWCARRVGLRLVLLGAVSLLLGQALRAEATVYVHESPVTFGWLPASGSVDHYNVYLSIDGNAFHQFREVKTNRCSVTLKDGRQHRLRVGSENASGVTMSEPSEEVVFFAKGSDGDTDGDGMPDAWELDSGLDPYRNDALEDPDRDGLTSLQEYLEGSEPLESEGNEPPAKPVTIAPGQWEAGVPLTPALKAGPFSDPDRDGHASTRWEIRANGSVVLAVTDPVHLTSVTVPESVLDQGVLYSWRARFRDRHASDSPWSNQSQFTTLRTGGDTDRNGVPDEQEVDDPKSDLDQDGVPDLGQTDIKCVQAAAGGGTIGLKRSSGVKSIEVLKAKAPGEIQEGTNRPDALPYGLVSFRLKVSRGGDSAEVLIYFSEEIPADARWFRYDSIKGWRDASGYVSIDSDRRSLALSLQDGAYGDADGTANGVVVDMGGVGYGDVSADDGGGGCGCVIVAPGLSTARHLAANMVIYLLPAGLILGLRRRMKC